MEMINKTDDSISAYTYLFLFEIKGERKFYYGVRYGNIRLGLRPSEDLLIKYPTSSNSVKNLLSNGVKPIVIKIHKCFNSIKEACDYEVRFLTRLDVKKKLNWLNRCEKFNNSLPNNSGRIHSNESKEKISKASSLRQSFDECKKLRSDLMKAKWNDPMFRSKMKIKNDSYWKGPSGQLHIATRKPTTLGKTHSAKTKKIMSEKAKLICVDVEFCKKRAMKRPRYKCPICYKENLDGGNFNVHMKSSHRWDKDQSTAFKFSNA